MKKLVTILLALAMLSIAFTPAVGAQGIDVYVTFDKTQYRPGEQGRISITIRNTSDDPLEVKNVSIVFSDWMIYTVDGWDELGNQTIVFTPALNIPSKTGVLKLDDVVFTVPTDGRATSTNVRIWIYTNRPTPLSSTRYVNVVDPSTQKMLGAWENMVLLLTVIAILVIIAAVIIAAAVFLSGRKPGVTWQKEQ